MNSFTASRPLVSVFGSSRTQPGSADWQWAETLGAELVRSGFDVCTGGYDGTMAAVSRGAAQAGGHVLGVTMEIFREVPNDHVKQEIRTADFFERLKFFCTHSTGFVVCRGGLGTLVELALVWNLAEVRLTDRPLVVQQDAWQPILDALDRHLIYHSGGTASRLLRPARTPQEAVRRLAESGAKKIEPVR